MEKINFYEEILKLEPESRLFYRLAQIHVSEKNYKEAISVLRRGIAAHPSHFEAKLLLISTLAICGDQPEELSKEVQALFLGMQKDAALWTILSDVATRQDENLALALRFLALALQKQKIDWNQVLAAGLKMALVPESSQEPASPGARQKQPSARPHIRTRTMADLLLQQNDPRQAREIYQELLQQTDDELEKSELSFILKKTACMEDNKPPKAKEEQHSLIEALSALADHFNSRTKKA